MGKTMTSALEQFQKSNAWDSRYRLPTCPEFNNPWIYMAYADLVIRQYDWSLVSSMDIWNYFEGCEKGVSQKLAAPGLFSRWPTADGGLTSYDEIMGAAYFSPRIAQLIHSYLETTDGIFNNTGEAKMEESMDIYRFPFMRPYLLSCAGVRVNLMDQALVCFTLLCNSFSFDLKNAGGYLKNYLLIYKMKNCWLVQLIGLFWRWQMKRHGCTFKTCLSKEPGDKYPIFGMLAKDDWLL